MRGIGNPGGGRLARKSPQPLSRLGFLFFRPSWRPEGRRIGLKNKKPRFAGLYHLRRGGDSNPRYLAVHMISNQAHSTTLTPLRVRNAKISDSSLSCSYETPTRFALSVAGTANSTYRPIDAYGFLFHYPYGYCA